MRWFLVLLVVLTLLASGYWYVSRESRQTTVSPLGQLLEKPLEKYTIENLAKTDIKEGKFENAKENGIWKYAIRK